MSPNGGRVSGKSDWSARLFWARKALELRLGTEISDGEFASRVARRMGRAEPHAPSSISQWKSGDQVPPPEVQLAIAQECGVDPGWLTYGLASRAPIPAPPLPPGSDKPHDVEFEAVRLRTRLRIHIAQHRAIARALAGVLRPRKG